LPDHAIEAVLLDFHGTIAQVENEVEWVLAAAAECGVDMEPIEARSLADRLVTAGRAGGRVPDRIPEHLVDAYAERDLTSTAHRTAYVGLAGTVLAEIAGLAEALYARLVRPEGWRTYVDTQARARLKGAADARWPIDRDHRDMTHGEPDDYAAMREVTVHEATVMKVGVYETWWDANARHPDWPLSRRLGLAERLVADLIANEPVEFFRGGWTGPDDGDPLNTDELPEVLRRWDTWIPHEDAATVWFRIQAE
jgi:hypothetical protein